jgi:hypothetical protein
LPSSAGNSKWGREFSWVRFQFSAGDADAFGDGGSGASRYGDARAKIARGQIHLAEGGSADEGTLRGYPPGIGGNEILR